MAVNPKDAPATVSTSMHDSRCRHGDHYSMYDYWPTDFHGLSNCNLLGLAIQKLIKKLILKFI